MFVCTASSRALLPKVRPIAAATRTSIATATLPLLKPRKRKNKANYNSAPPKSHIQRQIEKAKEQLVKNEDNDVKLPPIEGNAPTILAGPPPFISGGEFSWEMRQLWYGVLTDADKALNEKAKIQINMDIARMRQGGLSMKESKFVINKCLEDNDIDPIEQERIKDALRPRASDDFLEYTLKELVSPETLAMVQEAINKPPPEDFSPLHDRIENLWLENIPPFRKREYLEKKAELYFTKKHHAYWSWGVGKSMLPTLPAYESLTLGTPITEDNLDDVSVGSIVSFVVARRECQPAFVQKRIRALAGDIVEYKGKRMIVPDGHFWAVGDNEPESFDSRNFGAVPLTNLRRRAHISFSYSPPFIHWLSTSYTYNGPTRKAK